ncbi:MAG TPA: wax ester/triacylglycerol synthase family O-acyltransferase [Candidatus Dormibacteraeota bacterium]|nr:wax ester/triacylglycerol synthase family O-acyltransferase [Candidatus Dormibacteraeota bacterium]
MPRYAYDQLTFLDNSFLIMEGPNAPMHIAGTATFEGGSLIGADGALDIDTIRAYIASRLHLIPRYRQRLTTLPLQQRPIWVDDAHFNIHYHVRHTALPRPGDERQLKRMAARIMAQHLDRSKPLWEIWFIEGLDGGDRFAMVSKIHHCMVDGVSSVDLLNVLLQMEPSDGIHEAPEWMPRPAPTVMDLAAETVEQLATLPRSLGDTVRRTVRDAQDPRSDLRARLRAVRDSFTDGVRAVSATPLNRPIGPHRRFDWHRMPLAEIKAVKNALGGTLNDVVLATVSGAIRRFLERHRVDVDALDFRVMAPVSVRTADEHGTLGNRVSAWMVPLPLGERDPRAALNRIRETTQHLKESKEAMGAEVLAQVGEWTPSTLLSLASRMLTRALPFNLVVTNVPGPQLPLYLMSARMLDNFGLIPLTDYLCLGIVLFSYDGQLCWGFTCEWDLVPDLHDFVLDIRAAFAELQEAAAAVAPPPRVKRPIRKAHKEHKAPSRRAKRSRAGAARR